MIQLQSRVSTYSGQPARASEHYCQRCGEKLNPATMVWLELNNLTNRWHREREVPESESQGCFTFGSACAREVLAAHGKLKRIRGSRCEVTRSQEKASSLAITLGNDDAFPCTGEHIASSGLTKREYIATQALQGILGHSYNDATFEGAARDAAAHADALLEELAK